MPTSGITNRQQVELCAPCHSRRTELGDYDHRDIELLDHQVPTVLEEGLYYPDGQILDEVYVYASFTQSKMFQNDVRCTDCHDAHTLQLREEGNALCLRCHRAATYDRYEHHFHEPLTEDGEPNEGTKCVKCHMPERPYMVVDWRADHSIRVPRPDLTLELGTPNACAQSGCHDDETARWNADHYTEWYGRTRRFHYGTTIAAARRGDPDAGPMLIELARDPLYPAIVRATALSLLDAYPGDSTTAALRLALQDEDALTRYTAAEAATAPDPQSFVGLLAPLLFDPAKAVRGMAASRLAGLPRELFKPYQAEALDEAIREYVRTMEYSLDFAFAGHNLGNLYTALGDTARAEAYYRDAIEVDDAFLPAKMNLAVLLSAQGRITEAETLVRQVLSVDPDLGEAVYSLALLAAEQGEIEEAAGLLRRATELMPRRSRAFFNLGLAEQQLGRLDEAERAFQGALALDPGNLDYLSVLADHYARRRDLEGLREIGERLEASYPSAPITAQVREVIQRAEASRQP
jgi:predicted CXXCH cytochrome family protein